MERIVQLISQIGGIPAVEPDTVIYEAGFSSMRMLELLLALEEQYGIKIPDQEFITMRTAREMAALVERLRERGEA